MKTRTKNIALTFILMLFGIVLIVGCGSPTTTPTDEYKVVALEKSISLDSSQLEDYDFTTLFKITKNDTEIQVSESFIDKSLLKNKTGSYIVSCVYENESASVIVNVSAIQDYFYELELLQNEITVTLSNALTYDYNSLFVAKLNYNEYTITKEMVETNISNQIGTYTYKVKLSNLEKELTIHVVKDYNIEIVPSYRTFELELSQIDTFDYSKLFSLYVDGVAQKVTSNMIDLSNLLDAKIGDSVVVSLTHRIGSTEEAASLSVNIVKDSELKISAKNIITYPNSEYLDKTSLFTITKGNENITVTSDMISGDIDYSSVGVNTITLNYEGHTAHATVEVKRGAIIDYSKSDTIVITKGTNKAEYPFINDFKILINGMRFENISDSYIDISNVDFNSVGTYVARVRIPYNDKSIGLSGQVNFTYYEKKITYVVTANSYSLSLNSEIVVLPNGTTSYNVFNNVNLYINKRNQSLTTNPLYVDSITCYAEVVSDPIDFTSIGEQTVELNIYVNGPSEDPVKVSYSLIIESNVVVESTNAFIFQNDTIYATSLFSITDGGSNVEVTNDMISGKIDSFVPGVYYVSIDYQGIVKKAKVVVFDNLFKGIYKTNLTTIAKEATVYDDEEDYGIDDSTPEFKIADLIIESTENFTIGDKSIQIIEAIDNNTFTIQYAGYIYTMYYNNGIIVMDPDNSVKLGFNDNKRPLVYFNQAKYSLEHRLTINYGSKYVLNETSTTYSIDCIKVKNLETNTYMWYGLKVRLAEKTSADTIYVVEWGTVEFDNDFVLEENASSALTFKNKKYTFVLSSNTLGKINVQASEKIYANKVFKGTVDGKSAELRVNQLEAFSLYVDSQLIFNASLYELNQMINGGINYSTNTVFLYSINENIYSYKFILNTNNNTFELVEKDKFFGYYSNNTYSFFFDGYGTGVARLNPKSFTQTQFTYQANNNEVELFYQNTNPSFKFGEGASFYLDDFGNILSAKYFNKGNENSLKLENTTITSGILVRISNYHIGQDSDAVAKAALYNSIEIITKDGIVSNSDKSQYIDTSKIRFSVPGFYQFSIKANLFGKEVVSYYAIEIVESIYNDNPLAKQYGQGIINPNNSLGIDKYGKALVECNGILFEGKATIFEDNTFVINAKNEISGTISATGYVFAPGIVLLRSTGAASFTDLFTLGTVNNTGTKDFVLRKIDVSENTTYILAKNTSDVGEIVSVECINSKPINSVGAILKITSSIDQYVKIIDFGNIYSGIQLSDLWRGNYTKNEQTLIVDGFGNATIGEFAGTYIMNNNVLTLTLGSNVKLFSLSKETMSFVNIDVVLDNSLVSGKTFEGNHTFYCGSIGYLANTSFSFEANGKVLIISKSSSHDDGEEACGEDIYTPTFASKNGVEGAYFVTGNQVTISVNSEQFVFVIDNVLQVSKLTCISTTLTNQEHGYFALGTSFTI